MAYNVPHNHHSTHAASKLDLAPFRQRHTPEHASKRLAVARVVMVNSDEESALTKALTDGEIAVQLRCCKSLVPLSCRN